MNMEILNEYSGLFSLIAAIAAVIALVLPFIFRKQEEKEKRQELLDELNIRNNLSRFPMSNAERESLAKNEILKKKLKK